MPFEQAFFDAFGGELGAQFGEAFAPARDALCAFARPGRPVHSFFQQQAACTLLIDEVEAIWATIAERDNWSAFTAKIEAIREMGEALALGMTP